MKCRIKINARDFQSKIPKLTLSEKEIRISLYKSLKNLQRNYIDIFFYMSHFNVFILMRLKLFLSIFKKKDLLSYMDLGCTDI